MNCICKLNDKYYKNNCNGSKLNNNNYILIEGKNNILLSAPHAVRQREKLADSYTGAIVEYLAKNTNSYAIIRCCNFSDDPNRDDYGKGLEYKDKIIDIIRQNSIEYMFYIHGCNDYHEFDIDLGTNNGKNCTSNLIHCLKNEFSKFNVKADSIFKASKDNNVSKYVHDITLIDCVQIEICKNIRYDESKLDLFVSCFMDVINKLSK